MYLSLDGSATIYVNTSVPALNALRGSSFDARPNAPLDRAAVRDYFTSPATRVTRVSTSRRNDRRFVHVRIEVDDVRRSVGGARSRGRRISSANAADRLSADDRRRGGRSGRTRCGWTGQEIVAFRLHLPSRVVYHNAGPGNLRRGNILVWEQPLAERLRGAPLTLDARMESQSILYSTLLLFGGTFAAVAVMFAVVIWRILRAGRAAWARAEGFGKRGAMTG